MLKASLFSWLLLRLNIEARPIFFFFIFNSVNLTLVFIVFVFSTFSILFFGKFFKDFLIQSLIISLFFPFVFLLSLLLILCREFSLFSLAPSFAFIKLKELLLLRLISLLEEFKFNSFFLFDSSFLLSNVELNWDFSEKISDILFDFMRLNPSSVILVFFFNKIISFFIVFFCSFIFDK